MANFTCFTALTKTHGRIFSLGLGDGGHLSWGHRELRSNISQVSKYFEVMHYETTDGVIDYEKFAKLAQKFRPKIIITGGQNYPRVVNWKTIRKVCDKINAYMIADISNIAGLISSGLIEGPF